MRTIEKKVYTFDELSDDAKSRALDWMRDYNAEDWDWRDLTEDFETVAKTLGVWFRNGADDSIWFRGFYSQGDGLCFDATYSYRPGAAKKIREYAPLDKDLHAIADGLQKMQRPFFYRLSGSVSKSRQSMRCKTRLELDPEFDSCERRDLRGAEEDFDDLMNDLANWMWCQLRNDYEYRTSDEACEEDIKANEYEFDEEGHIG